MSRGRINNLVQIVNNEIILLNGLLRYYQLEMYPAPHDITAAHAQRMINDLDWIMESIETAGTEDDVHLARQYDTVRGRLVEIRDHLAESDAEADHDRR